MFLDTSRLGQPLSTKDDDELRFNCCYCNDEGFHLYVNIRKRMFNCFKCQAKGRTNVNPDMVASVHLSADETIDYGPIRLPAPAKELITPTALRYLDQRGILESDVQRHSLYCAASTSIYFGRVIIPFGANRGFADYFAARAYTRIGWPKYLNPPNRRSRLLCSPQGEDGYHKQLWPSDHIMLVEGPVDYVKASRHGPAAALLGKKLSHDAAREIVTRFAKVYIMLDRGLPEQQAALEIDLMLRPFMVCETLEPFPGLKDPGDMTPEQFEEVLNQ